MLCPYHDREGDLELIHSLEHTQHYKEPQLDHSVDVNAIVGYPPEVFTVRATLAGDEEQLNTLNELDPIQGGHAHVQ